MSGAFELGWFRGDAPKQTDASLDMAHAWARNLHRENLMTIPAVAEMVRAVRYVVFDADWQEPPGTVVKVFGTRDAALAYCLGPEGDGHGYSIFAVPAPEDRRYSTLETYSKGLA